MKSRVLQNQSGFITVDFLFAFILILGFSAILFALTFTLTVVEIAQYSTYASARVYYGANKSQAQQRQAAIDKYKDLTTKNKVFAPLFKNGWFKIQAEPFVGDPAPIMPGYAKNALNSFLGVNTVFNAEILKMQIPLFGSADPEDKGFKTTIGSYLGREPSSAECIAVVRNRWNAIQKLKPSTGASYQTNTTPAGYMPVIDDGC